MLSHALKTARRGKRARSGFTLIEIMIVVLIIGILLAIAVPNFVKARESSRAKSCVANLKQIQSAKEQYAMDNRLAGTASVSISSNLVGTDSYIRTAPACPSGGTYATTTVDANPTCTIGANANDPNLSHILQ